MNLDDLEEKFGGISLYQITVIVLTGTVICGTSSMSQSAIFLSAVPEHRCAVLPIDGEENFQNLTEKFITTHVIPSGDSCHRFDYNLTVCFEDGDLSCISNQTNVGTVECDNGYVYNKTYFSKTTVSEWDLVCGRTTLDSLATTLYFVGVFIGSFLVGPMLDWFGRKLTIYLTALLFTISGIASAYAPSYEVYIALRVAVAMTGIPCFVAYFTYATEMCGKKSRNFVASYVQAVSGIMHTALPAIAYFIRDWRQMNLVLSCMTVPYIVMFYFLPRSPRWLIAHGKQGEAKQIIARYAKSKNVELTDHDWNSVIENDKETLSYLDTKKKVTIGDLFRTPCLRVASLVVIFLWFVVSLVFYGFVLNVGKLAGDPYINRVFNGFVELLAGVMYLIPIHYLGRRMTTCLTYLLAGVCCLLTMLLEQFSDGDGAMLECSRWIGILGKFFASVGFFVMYQYTAELYPTIARGTGVGMGSMAARVGSIVMPWTLEMQVSVPWLTQTIFGVFGLLAGASSLLLPETKDLDLLTTLEQAEAAYRNKMKISSQRCVKVETENSSSVREPFISTKLNTRV